MSRISASNGKQRGKGITSERTKKKKPPSGKTAEAPEILAEGGELQKASQIISGLGWAESRAHTPYAAVIEGAYPTEQHEQDLGFIARAFAQMGLPHSDPGDHVRTFQRRNGIYRLKLTADEESHLPYGSIPRVLLAFVGTEAVRTRSPQIYLGKNLSEFLHDKLRMQVSGGARGTITSVREQAWRLFTCTISVAIETGTVDEQYRRLNRMLITEDIQMWSRKRTSSKAPASWQSRLELSQKFFDYLVEHPVPIDWNAVRRLSRSSLALDLYFWLTHRMSYLRQQTTVPWFGPGSLFEQLGSDYKDDRFGRRAFRTKVIERLLKILDPAIWPDCHVQASEIGLVLRPSRTHVPKAPAKAKIPPQSEIGPGSYAETVHG